MWDSIYLNLVNGVKINIPKCTLVSTTLLWTFQWGALETTNWFSIGHSYHIALDPQNKPLHTCYRLTQNRESSTAAASPNMVREAREAWDRQDQRADKGERGAKEWRMRGHRGKSHTGRSRERILIFCASTSWIPCCFSLLHSMYLALTLFL